MRLRDPRDQAPGHAWTTYQPERAQPEPLFVVVGWALFTVPFRLLRLLGRLAVRYPVPAGVVVVAGLVAWTADPVPVLIIAADVGAGSLLIRYLLNRFFPDRARHRWQRRTRRRLVRDWPLLCDRIGLLVTDRDRRTGTITESFPGITRPVWSPDGAMLTAHIGLVPGQLVDDLGEVADRISEATGAHRARITRTGPATARLDLLFGDPLQHVVPPLPITAPVNLAAVPVGLREDHTPWLLRLIGTHLLVVGVTGAGKGSVVWSLLRAIGPAIADGSVAVWAVDGKAGMELAPGRDLFAHLATTVEDAVELLEDAVAVMTKRAMTLAGHARVHTPSTDEPLIVVLVDEVALLTAYQPDRKLRERAEKALATIATQGRAPGVVLVAALQDPRKEVLGLRNLFPTKIGMRLERRPRWTWCSATVPERPAPPVTRSPKRCPVSPTSRSTGNANPSASEPPT